MNKEQRNKILDCLKKVFPDWESNTYEEVLNDAIAYIGETPILKFLNDGDWQTQDSVLSVLQAIKES